MTRLRPEAVIILISLLVAGCVPLPQRVQDEFSRYDGERPSNFLTTRKPAAGEEAAADTPATDAVE